jgi:hypothetical protein
MNARQLYADVRKQPLGKIPELTVSTDKFQQWLRNFLDEDERMILRFYYGQQQFMFEWDTLEPAPRILARAKKKLRNLSENYAEELDMMFAPIDKVFEAWYFQRSAKLHYKKRARSQHAQVAAYRLDANQAWHGDERLNLPLAKLAMLRLKGIRGLDKTCGILIKAGCETVRDVTKHTLIDIEGIKGMTDEHLSNTEKFLATLGFALADHDNSSLCE